MKVRYPNTNYEVLVEPIEGTKEFIPLPQIVVVSSEGQNEQILITDTNIDVEELDTHVRDTGFKGKITLWPIGPSEKEQFEILELIRKSKLFTGEIFDEDIQPSVEIVEARSTVTVDKRYFRAIAKIAFHYLLANYGGFLG
ncbi:MAG: hypothetical protein IID32_07465, partial [Planctomycetes bacterium]|nr:hypothetical protein [Planctomycetota bacterium]